MLKKYVKMTSKVVRKKFPQHSSRELCLMFSSTWLINFLACGIWLILKATKIHQNTPLLETEKCCGSHWLSASIAVTIRLKRWEEASENPFKDFFSSADVIIFLFASQVECYLHTLELIVFLANFFIRLFKQWSCFSALLDGSLKAAW